MGIMDRIKRVKNFREIKGMSQKIDRQEGNTYGQKLQKRFEQRKQSFRSGETQAGRWQQRFQKYAPRATPSSQQRFFKQRAKILRGVQTAVPYTRIPGVKSQVQSQGRGRVKQGRGRPTGTFKYFIPGRGTVDVFTYRRFLANQKQIYRQQLQQQFAMQKVASKVQRQMQPQLPQDIQGYPQQQVQMPQQQSPYPQFQQKPQFAGQSVMPTEPQPFKEISVLERTPVNLSGNTLQSMRETYEETDLMTGQRRLRLRDGGFM